MFDFSSVILAVHPGFSTAVSGNNWRLTTIYCGRLFAAGFALCGECRLFAVKSNEWRLACNLLETMLQFAGQFTFERGES